MRWGELGGLAARWPFAIHVVALAPSFYPALSECNEANCHNAIRNKSNMTLLQEQWDDSSSIRLGYISPPGNSSVKLQLEKSQKSIINRITFDPIGYGLVPTGLCSKITSSHHIALNQEPKANTLTLRNYSPPTFYGVNGGLKDHLIVVYDNPSLTMLLFGNTFMRDFLLTSR